MTDEDKEKAKKILLACVQKLEALELKLSLRDAQTLIEVHDGLGTVHNMLNEPVKAETKE